MSGDGQDFRYAGKRNIWRKVYSYNRQKPKILNFVDIHSSKSISFDLNQTYRHRDYFVIKDNDLQGVVIVKYAEYDEGLVYFDNETFVTGNYNFEFSGDPFVVFSVEPTENSSSNINAFGLSLPISGQFVVGVSAPFSGAVRYRAVFSDLSPNYPALVLHGGSPKTNSPFTASLFTIYGGEVDVTDQSAYTASYTITPGTIEYRASAHDSIGNNTANVELTNESFNLSGSANTISSNLTNKIHFIVTSQ
jgi:hypothetical protein